jgi:hypothetical protein
VKNQAILGILLILVGLVSVPVFKDTIGRLLLFAIFGGLLLFSVAMVVGGIVLIALRGAR